MTNIRRAMFIASDAGMGHLVRCRALAAELVMRGWAVSTFGQPPNTPNGKVSEYDVVLIDGYDYPPETYTQFDQPTVAVVDHSDRDYPVALLVNGCAGAKPAMYAQAKKVLAGPEYALLRPEFRERRWREASTPHLSKIGVFDARTATGLSPYEMACSMADAAIVVTNGGMRCLEAACVGATISLALPLDEHEELNRYAGLYPPDGLGCQRVGDAIEELVR